MGELCLPGRSQCALLLGIIFIFGQACAEQVELSPVKDNTLYESGTGSLSNGAGAHFFAGSTSAGDLRRGLIAFDVAGAIPADSTITGAVLELTMSRTLSGTRTISLFLVGQDWGEGASNAAENEGQGATAQSGDATWLHTFFNSSQWSTPGGDISGSARASTSVGAEGVYQWSGANLTQDAQNWLDNPGGNFGWILIGDESNSSTAKRFNSRQAGSISTRPKLTITYTPPVSNPEEKWVDFAFAGEESGTENNPFNTLAEGVSAVNAGGTVFIKTGAGSEALTISKAVTLVASGGPVRIGVAPDAKVATRSRADMSQPGMAAGRQANRPGIWRDLWRNFWRDLARKHRANEAAEISAPEAFSITHASPTETLWIQVTADAPIATETLLADIQGADETEVDAVWEPVSADRFNELWVGVTPRNAWPDRARITLVVSGQTTDGNDFEPASQTWRIQP